MAQSSDKIQLLFFGATADITGVRGKEIDAADNGSVQSVIDSLAVAYPRLAEHRLLTAVNEEYSSADRKLAAGDRVAIFTAVSGG